MDELPGFRDGKYEGTVNQHVVPQLHLRRFANINGITNAVYTVTGKKITCNIANTCSSNWIYDYYPEDPNSLENQLRQDELWMGSFLNSIESGNEPSPKDLIKYVSLLVARSWGIIESASLLEPNDSRLVVKDFYDNRKHLFHGHDPSSFGAFI